MRGDYTRLTFKPGKDYAGVRMQQGRVQLDADFNEQAELLDRRLRAGSLDILGRGAIPRGTPDGFRIELTGMGLMIGRGRAYVDGLLAENHGSGGQRDYDSALGELHDSEPISYGHQPYRLDRPELPTEGTYLAYLDVWQRELTHLGEPLLVEKAVGFDTSTRLQTVWQVGLVKAGEGATCDEEVGAWRRLTWPSAGRLTTHPVGVPAPDDPCTVPPAGGYRGTENRLYRVEIHDPGPLGQATFKWSRDNGSIASPAIGIDAARKKLTLVSVGRDGAQRLRPGDWIEVTDDRRELDGMPGEMRRIDRVEEETQTIELASALPAGAFDPDDPARHTRITRWDGSGPEVDAGGGLLSTPATGTGAPIKLEDGVEIAFDTDSPGGEFRVGDWWTFAARTADASVEELHCESPHGVHHHYCRLAIVDFSSGAVTDCRTLWPPEIEAGGGCECTVCVSPEEHEKGTMTIQMAVNRAVEHGGGKICLEPGLYSLEKPVHLRKADSIRLQGKGNATMLVPTRGLPALVVEGSKGVSIEDLAVRTGSAIRDREEAARTTAELPGVAIVLCEASDIAIEGCCLRQPRDRGRSGPLIGLRGMVTMVGIRDNALFGTIGIAALVDTGRGGPIVESRVSLEAATRAGDYLATTDLRIEDNLMGCAEVGVFLEDFVFNLGLTRIAGNWVFDCEGAGVAALGFSGPGANQDISGNTIASDGYGIVVATDDARIVDNDLRPKSGSPESRDEQARRGSRESELSGEGIVLGFGRGSGGIDRCLVRGNRLVGLAGEGIVIRAPVASARIEQNVIERLGGAGISMEGNASAGTLAVDNNQVLDVAPEVDSRGEAVGIRIAAAQDVSVAGNTIAGVGRDAGEGTRRCGIQLMGCGVSRIAGNDVADIGPRGGFAEFGMGIAVFAPLSDLEVAGNSVRRNSSAPAGAGTGYWIALTVIPLSLPTAPNDEVVQIQVPELPGRALRLDAGAMLMGESVAIEAAVNPTPSLSVTGNLLEAYGSNASSALLWITATCQFADNRCLLAGRRQTGVVSIVSNLPAPSNASPIDQSALAVAVDGNVIVGPEGVPGIQLGLAKSFRYTVLGNVSSGPIKVNGAPLGPPWAALNAA